MDAYAVFWIGLFTCIAICSIGRSISRVFTAKHDAKSSAAFWGGRIGDGD